MSAARETIKELAEVSEAKPKVKSKAKPMMNRALDFLSSVRFGVALLVILVFLSFLGMVIIQQNVQGFDAYYASLTPAEKFLYGKLGLFDIYYSWYFKLLLMVLSLNIVLASIDHFPASWSYIAKPKTSATRQWLLAQKQNAAIKMIGASESEISEKISRAFQEIGLKPSVSQAEYLSYATDENGERDYSQTVKKTNLFVFGERGKWNRLGAYLVHITLLTLFLGHVVALQTGFDADVRMMPGQTTNEIQQIQLDVDKTERYSVALPFTITCTDIEQKLIDPKGSIEINNTLDWRTQIQINDPEYGVTVADVALNKPFSYRGYRFFQASAITLGSARTMKLEVTPQIGGETLNIELARNGSATLPDGTKIYYEAFFADFAFNAQGQPDTRSGEYNNPAVKLNLETPSGEQNSVYAFAAKLPDNAPVGAPVAGYKWRLAEFEKVPLAHVLSIKYDPYSGAFIAWYFGGVGLMGALVFVFFISHRRLWAMIEKNEISGTYEVILGGNTNRNHQDFEDKFKKLVRGLEVRG